MATLVFAPVTFNLAEVTRMIEVAKALPRHRAVFMGYEPEYVPLIEQAGFEYRPQEPVWTPAERRQALAFDQGRSLRHPFTPECVRARVAVERALIREVGAAAVVIGTNVSSLISARAEGVPLFYPVPFALTQPHVTQSAKLGLVRGEGTAAAFADGMATQATRWAYTRLPVAPRAFRVVARENGAQPLRTVASLLEADHNLLTVLADELEGYVLPEGYRRVGPIFAHLPGEVPEVVHELASRDRPLIYLALGSSGNRRLALRAAAAMADFPVNVVAPVRHLLAPGDEDDLPPNVTVTDLLPAHLLGGLVDAAVLHGGQGTVQTACATGVPFVGMGLQPEQAWNVAVCRRRGNAVALAPAQVGRPAFRRAVRRVVTDPEIREAAERTRHLYAQEDGAAAAAAVIEETLG